MTHRSSDHDPAPPPSPAFRAGALLRVFVRPRLHGVLGARLRRCRNCLPLIGLLVLVGPRSAQATGFTGTFDPTTWVLVNTYTNPSAPTQTLGFSGLVCNDGPNEVACVESYTVGNTGNPGNASLKLLGALEELSGGGSAGQTTVTRLTMTNAASPATRYSITFNWGFTGPGNTLSGGQYATLSTTNGWITTAGVTQGTTYSSTADASISNESATVILESGGTLSFAITSFNTGQIPSLQVSNFNAQAVPAPLPAAGAASAFGLSRRIRRRIKKGQAAGATRSPGRTAPHPSAYLNLSPSDLKQVPLTFTYPMLPPANAPAATGKSRLPAAPRQGDGAIESVTTSC